jgi:hypothetical protein
VPGGWFVVGPRGCRSSRRAGVGGSGRWASARALGFGQVAGRHGEGAVFPLGAQGFRGAGAAAGGGELDHDRVLAMLGARCPGRRGCALGASDGLVVVVATRTSTHKGPTRHSVLSSLKAKVHGIAEAPGRSLMTAVPWTEGSKGGPGPRRSPTRRVRGSGQDPDLPRRALPAHRQAPRQAQGPRGSRQIHPDHRMAPARRPHCPLPRPGRRPLHQPHPTKTRRSTTTSASSRLWAAPSPWSPPPPETAEPHHNPPNVLALGQLTGLRPASMPRRGAATR